MVAVALAPAVAEAVAVALAVAAVVAAVVELLFISVLVMTAYHNVESNKKKQ